MLSFADMLTIRAATRTDLSALALLWHEKMILQSLTPADDTSSPRRMPALHGRRSTDARLSDPQYALFAAESDGVLVGYVAGSI